MPRGSFFALLGPSGLRQDDHAADGGRTGDAQLGLDHPGRQDITYAKPYQRPVNTVFQSYALFPHLDIYENVAFGLRRRKKGDVDTQVREMLELVELRARRGRSRPSSPAGSSSGSRWPGR